MFKKILLAVGGVLAVLWLAVLFVPAPSYRPYEPSPEYVAKAADYLKRNLTDMPDDWRWDYFVAGDGKKMRWGSIRPTGELRGTVIFVPGYTGSLEMYADYYRELLARGYEVYGFDLRGQGGSARMLENPEKPWVGDFGDYSDDLAGFVTFVRPKIAGRLVLLGESFGGHVSIRAVGDHSLPVDGLFLSAPAVQIQTGDNPYGLTRRMVEISRMIGFGKRYAAGQGDWQPYRTNFQEGNYCGENFERIHIKDTLFTARPELRVGGATNQWTAEFMESSERINNASFMGNISVPVIVATGDADAIVRADISTKACDELMRDCGVLVLENSGHCTISEPEPTRQKMFDGLDALFLRLQEEKP